LKLPVAFPVSPLRFILSESPPRLVGAKDPELPSTTRRLHRRRNGLRPGGTGTPARALVCQLRAARSAPDSIDSASNKNSRFRLSKNRAGKSARAT